MWREPANRILVIARHQLVLLRRAPGPLIAYTVMPIVLTTLLEPVRAQLADAGTPGIVAAAPGMLVMFSLFMTGVIGDSLLVERAWNTWDRLRTTPTRPLELLVGKALPLLAALLAQQAVVLGYAAVAYRLDLAAAGPRTAAVGGAWALCVVGCGTALATAVRSHAQLSAVKDIATLALAGLGGALIPVALLPSWAGPLAPLSPGFWAMRGYTDALTGRTEAAGLSIGILLAVGATGLAAAALRIRRTTS
ncbi:ABC transporter permease [Micromonospora sp. NPDC048999]|uniref:ABC transporter permease n=1 Tax=Micromonospora sp. NPDC048999 TaxID=3155391 RepID=UPI0033FC2662